MERRNFVRGIGMVTLTGALAGCSGGDGGDGGDETTEASGGDETTEADGGDGSDGSGGGEASVPSEADEYLDGAKLYEGSAVDKTGSDSVGVDVGGGANGLAYDPPAVVVSTGTTVTWTWTGEGGGHNVVAEDESFNSGETVAEEGATFEHTFEETGVYNYFCSPHKALGMKGSIIVE